MKTNNDDWITIKPNGEENKGRHLLIKEGETAWDAVRRVYGDPKQKSLFDLTPYKKHTADFKREAEEEKKRLQPYVEREKQRQERLAEQRKTEKEERGKQLIRELSSKESLRSRASRQLAHEVEELVGEDSMSYVMSHLYEFTENDLLNILKEKFMPRNRGAYTQKNRQISYSKNLMKKNGFKDSEIKEISAEAETISKQLDEIFKNDELSYDEQATEFNKLQPQIDALKQKYNNYVETAQERKEKAKQKKEAKETSIKTAKDFEIVKETPKAYLIKKNGRQAWIQKRWVKDDGTLSPAGEQSLSRGEKVEDIERENAERDKGLELPKADWESEKAYGFDIDISIENPSDPDGESRKTRHRIFIPKSMVKEGRIPTWLIEKKLDDAKYQYFSERGGYTTGIGSIGSVFGKDTYLEGGHERIAFTKEKADYEKHKNDYLLDVNNHVIRFGNALLCKVQNKFLCIYNEFEEAKHPRDKNGQFAKKGYQSGGVGRSIKTNKDFENIIERTQKSNKTSFTPQQILQNFLNENPQADASKVQEAIKNAEDYKNAKSFINKNGQKQYSDTQGIYTFKDKTGKRVYTTERLKLHKDILEKLFANKANAKPKDGKAPVFTILGGRGGSGKSKLKGLAYDDKTSVILDADAIKEMLPEYKGFNAWEVHEESSDIVKEALKKARSLGVNVVLDGTLSGYDSAEKKIKYFEDAGYNIDGYYMHLPREESAKRGISRFMQAKDGKGRYVPLDVMLDMKDNEDNFKKLLPHFRKWAMWDNNVKMGQKPILVQKSWN